MPAIQRLLLPLAWLLTTASAASSYVVDSVSFGQSTPLSRDGTSVPGWRISGEGHQVQLLSDRLILTPPIPGHTRGAIWSDASLAAADWTAEFEFRASGQDYGTGNLNLWFTQSKDAVGTNSVYTVEQFDGLAIVIDQYGNTGGKLRGFLNDGTQNYKGHNNPETLAFGHCDYKYRNLGRLSKVQVTNHNGLRVTVDGRECFKSEHISLPAGYYFGVTAATADNPDTFEINKLIVSTPSPSSPEHLNHPSARSGAPPQLQKLDRFPGAPEAVPDVVADDIRGTQEQFTDLHNRLQGLTHQIANIFVEFDQLSKKIDSRHQELLGGMPTFPTDAINSLGRRVEGIERIVQQVQRDVEGRDYKQHFTDLQKAVDGVKGGITEHLPDTLGRLITTSAPRMGTYVAVVVAVQIMLAGAYIVYKRRRASMPKKYL